MHEVNGQTYIVSAARTPIGKFGGALSGVPATTLGGVAIQAAVERAGLDPRTAQIDDVLMGQVLQAGSGQAPARQAALKAGLPDGTSATTSTASADRGSSRSCSPPRRSRRATPRSWSPAAWSR